METDKIRMSYIESEMAKRYRHNATADTTESDPASTDEATSGQPSSSLPQREPASLGKLHEIDLGQEAKLRNIARTEEATRKLAHDGDMHSADDQAASSGAGERSWRHRKRRTSEDIKRDRLVEEVLRESKCKLTLS